LTVASEKLATGLLDLIPDDDDRAYIGPRLGRLLGLHLPGDAEGDLTRVELFAGWRHFFERLGDRQPVVILVEDAQYGDAALLDFVDHLVDWARNSPIFVLVFARPDLDQVRPGFGTGRNRSTLTLDPLDDHSVGALIDALVPGMPAAARRAIQQQAEGIPLFAVETVRSLVDRGVVIPRDGVHQLVGELGPLSVPAGLHALLAARLDALDPDLRSLVAEAAVLGSSFPAEALIAVSSQSEEDVRAGLTELLRRDLLAVTADRLSPQRGDYRFAQDLLRQVAYESSSRRDRKTRHLAVAAHLRSAFPADGDEVAEIISRHYLDALAAVPDAPDVPSIRAEAVAMLVRAGERALRAGASRQAGASYAAAATQTELITGSGDPETDADLRAAGLWEKAAQAGVVADLDDTLAFADRASELNQQRGEARAAARCQAIAGEFLLRRIRHDEAREYLTRALDVLRHDPDGDTVQTLSRLGWVETLSGRPDAERLTAEALALGQSLDVEPALLANLFIGRGVALAFTARYSESIAHLEYGARLAERANDRDGEARAWMNLGEILTQRDPSAAASAAHKGAELARHCGNVLFLSVAIVNEAEALLLLGEWEHAHHLLHSDADRGEMVELFIALLAGLRGDVETAERYAALPETRKSGDSQSRVSTCLIDSIIAATQHRDSEALSHARSALRLIPELSAGHFFTQWAWGQAARSAQALHDTEATRDLVGLLDEHPIGHLSPLLRGERALASARLAAMDSRADAAVAFQSAISALRKAGSPYHLAHGLLDQAEYLAGGSDAQDPLALISEAQNIGEKLGAGPLLERCEHVVARVPESAESALS
jgi:tetratricopeptide (TPR) repeat protein